MGKSGSRSGVWLFLLFLVVATLFLGWQLASLFYSGVNSPSDQVSDVLDRLEELEERQDAAEDELDGLAGSARWPWYLLIGMLVVAFGLVAVVLLRPSSKFGSNLDSMRAIRLAKEASMHIRPGFRFVTETVRSGQKVDADPETRWFAVGLYRDYDDYTQQGESHECITFLINNQHVGDISVFDGMTPAEVFKQEGIAIQRSAVLPSSPERVTHIHRPAEEVDLE